MCYGFLGALVPVICLLINVIAQVLCFRYLLKRRLLNSVYAGFISGLAGFVIYKFYCFSRSGIALKEFASIAAANLAAYCALGYCYFHFINLGETARRIRIIQELYGAPEGLTETEILKRYNASEIVEKRVNRLINNGQIVFDQGKYRIGRKSMLFMAKAIITLKIITFGRKACNAK